MCIVNNIRLFIANGARTLRSASRRNYGIQTDAMRQLYDEVLRGEPSGRIDDVINLRQDYRRIETDIRRSFNNIILSNA